MEQNLGPIIKSLSNKDTPLQHRKSVVIDLIANADEETSQDLFERMGAQALDQETKQLAQELGEFMDNMKRAPMKAATFIELTELEGSDAPYAMVLLDKGDFGYMVVHDHDAASQLKLGDRVALDGKATILIGKTLDDLRFGDEARLERKLDSRHIEVVVRDEKKVVLAHHKLIAELDNKKLKPGDMVVVSPGAQLAISSVPAMDALSHYRFLDRGPVPDVQVDRDIGSPPPVIEQVSRHVYEEMARPEFRRKFRLRPCITRLLSGVSGSGKTLAVQAIHRRMYEIMSQVTDTPIPELPQRVFRFRSSQILSMWLGESDKNADRLFDEVEDLAKQVFTNSEGKTFTLPVMVVMEEAEGVGRTRGGDRDGIYDRILSTLLQRLDPNRAGLADQLVVFLSTTNEPHLVDPAFLRRIGGSVERFGRLDRKAFSEVLKKHVRGLPAKDGNGHTQSKLWKDITFELEQWLYEEDDRPVVEVGMSGASAVPKFARDFLTGALIDRSIQESSTVAWEESLQDPDAGITLAHLKGALVRQVSHLADQLTKENASHYLDLPEGGKVVNVRRLVK